MNTPAKVIRSPSYPNMSLRNAVEAVGKIEKLYRSSPVDRTQAAKLIGYTSLSGPANKSLAALAAFGLLDRAGKGETRVTERARDILHAATEDERKSRLFEAAMEPALFRELRERFASVSVPPMDGVITYLNRQGFNPTAVRPAANAFLQTLSYLEEIGATNSHGATPQNPDDSGTTPEPEDPMTPPDAPQKPISPQKPGMLQEVFNLDEGPVTLSFPANLSSISYEDLKDRLDLLLRQLKRRVGRPETDTTDGGGARGG